ncbi:MAG: AraC family transcriptional regulator [Nannocystaceae bacterium]
MAGADYAGRVHRVMDHVRRDLTGDLDLTTLARVAHFSPYHFHRVFKAVAGETLTAFVQRARLERAAYLMKAAPARPLGSIALEVGFSAQSDFNRVFRRRYGLAPGDWDRASRLDDRPLVDDLEAIKRAWLKEHVPKATVVSRPACRLLYARTRGPFQVDALREGYAALTAWLSGRGVDWRTRPLVGLSWDHYETTPLDQVRYDLGFSVDEGLAPEGAFGVHMLPAARAVEVRCVGPLVAVAVAWDYLYDEWLPRSGREPAELPALKRFHTLPDALAWASWDVSCSIALK